MIEVWEHVFCEKRLKGLGLFRLEKAQGYLNKTHKQLKVQLGSGKALFRGPVPGQAAMGTN